MFCGNRDGIMRRGIAVLLLLLMACSGAGFVSDTCNAAEDEVVNAIADESADTTTEIGNVEVEAGDEKSEDVVEEIKEEKQVVIYAQGSDTASKKVKLYYNKKVRYENYRTHDFHVKCDGSSLVAYCIEPTQRLGKTRTFTASTCSSALLSKALYYSYGNPGYNAKSKAYLDGLKLKSGYGNETGRYAFCHVMLSYIYDGESEKGDAFKGCSSSTKTHVKKFVAAIKSWPDPPEKSELALSASSFEAAWSEELGMQETPEISVTGTEGNSINVPVPENVTLIKGEETATEGSVKVTTGESFRLRAPATVHGRYTSPVMATSMADFHPYIIKLSGRQDQLFGINRNQTISYAIDWTDFGRISLRKKSADEAITEGNEYYSLEGAEYELYSEESDRSYGTLVTDAEGEAVLENIPYGEYYIKESAASRGYELDTGSHEITVESEDCSIEVTEVPEVPEIETVASDKATGKSSVTEGGNVVISDTVKYSGVEPGLEYRIDGRLMDKGTGEQVANTENSVTFTPDRSSGSLIMEYNISTEDMGGRTVVAFEKMYYGEDLIAAHEDINNSAQSVQIIRETEKMPATGDDFMILLLLGGIAVTMIFGAWALVYRP